MRLIYGGKLLVISALTRAMNKNGYKVHVSHVSRVMRGERVPSKDFLEAVGKVLGLTVEEAGTFIDDCVDAIRRVESLPHLIEE